jgi:hypothetical protein
VRERKPQWPDERPFALTICDDTDFGTLENLGPVYEALHRCGLRTTKTVWSLPCSPDATIGGQTLSDPAYADWIRELAQEGFEIAWHGASSGGSTRSEVERGLQVFRDILGFFPAIYANHSTNIENIYWGTERFDNPLIRSLYRSLRPDHANFFGSSPGNKYFWGDLCRNYVRYVRDFTFNDIVTTSVDAYTPYYDPRRPYVRAWFSSSDGAVAAKFIRLLRPANLDRLEKSGGACIIYTHFACDFVSRGRLHPDVKAIFDDLRRRRGWYVPVRELLQHLEELHGLRQITRLQRLQLEARWSLEHFGSALGRRVSYRATRTFSKETAE